MTDKNLRETSLLANPTNQQLSRHTLSLRTKPGRKYDCMPLGSIQHEHSAIMLGSSLAFGLTVFIVYIALDLQSEMTDTWNHMKAEMAHFTNLSDDLWTEIVGLSRTVNSATRRRKRQSYYQLHAQNRQSLAAVEIGPPASRPIANCGCAPESEECPVGPAGPKGRNGEKGQPGVAGAYGIDGADASDMPRQQPMSVACTYCPHGEPGPTGTPGFAGARGRNGAKGVSGMEGRDGQPGSAGEIGPPGPTGVDGIRGRKGAKGKDGTIPSSKKGPKGPPGFSGRRGKAGIGGIPGPQGPPGKRGDFGFPGRRGMNGKNGPPGEFGTAGNTGEDGMVSSRRLIETANPKWRTFVVRHCLIAAEPCIAVVPNVRAFQADERRQKLNNETRYGRDLAIFIVFTLTPFQQ
ncbi:unnamed protein product [Toxocara canis]|uniref:Col_cuticle_N domain-containing protein n=1 Tax=Toxocara canis TaxID=6265 RepID=A0A183V2L1_TOXCA|nr:unnamed protein product [Toxocara canis]